MRSILRIALVALVFACACPTAAAEQIVIVNGVRLPNTAVVALQLAYRTIMPSGRYWYDPASGLWGREGGPLAGQMQAGLQLGGSLKSDASDGDTSIYVNGRRLPRAELYAHAAPTAMRGGTPIRRSATGAAMATALITTAPNGDSVMTGDC